MNKFIVSIVALAITTYSTAGAVRFSVSGGIYDNAVRTRIETSVSKLLTEVNSAQSSGRNINFSGLNLNQSVQKSMAMLWENSPFMCTDDEIVESCLTTPGGYQVRNIPLMMTPRKDREFNENEYQEAVISFDRSGNIESFYLSINMNLYMNVIKSNLELTDLRRRQLILDYVEQFRTSYNTKDIDFLRQVFSDDALIITGKVIKQKPADGIKLPDKITYKKQSKKEYLTRLQSIYASNSYIKVTFDEIKVMRHPTNKDFYGVTLHQGYTSNRYHDDGYLFLLWDFRDESMPQIHVRTWQPDKLNGERLPEDDIFTLSDFDI